MVATIKRVEFYGEESAEVTISDDTHECVVHCYPCDATVDAIVTEPLGTLDADVMLASDVRCGFKKLSTGYFAYHVIGRVVDVSNGIIAVGEIKLDVDPLPGGIQIGDFVEFNCPRIDLH